MKIVKTFSILLLILGMVFLGYFVFDKLPSKTITMDRNDELSGVESFNFNELKNNIKSILGGDKEYVDVVVFGIPGEGYKASLLADSIFLARYNIKNNKLFLISIPRDLWVSDESQSFKFNEVLSRNKIGFSLNLIEKITGIYTSNYAVIDLNTTSEVVDWLGGVDVYLDEPAIDWVSGYTLEKGEHHLNGEDAVWLIRNRYNEKGDFFRENNQHKIIEAVIDEFINLSNQEKLEFVKYFVLDSSLLDNISVDFSDAIPLLFDDEKNEVSIRSIVLSPETDLFKISEIDSNTNSSSTNISVVVPTSGFGDYSEIRKYVQELVRGD